ncbi:hypothetical protein JVU11DRAFT_3455 [Chiua virens]|nr:hypothetical protein JVU11DRAFT_3455 [Chiua virens]
MDVDVAQPQSASPPATSTVDMASSLRTAALLSRKRRRVVADTHPLPPRLAPLLQLDYGYHDPAAAQSDRNLSPVPAPEPTDHREDFEDGQIREEGEISDTENSPPPRRSPTPPPRLRQRLFTSQSQEFARTEIPLSAHPPARIDTAITSPLEPSDAQSWRAASLEPFVLETSTYRLDSSHVRPGLTMTQGQYNTAKDIVLDLLGWGVPPEYLLECGLSRHVIFYVFSELNLRLPSNLDTSGLIPYPTPEILALIPVSPSLSMRSLHSSSSTMPPPSVIPARASLAERMSMERIDTRMSTPDPSPFIKAEPSSPSSADLSNSHSLLVIEQQRRQELLARKAVIASRRARQTEPPGLITPTKDQDIDGTAVPASSVDDFLKTIEPVPDLDDCDSDSHNRGSSVGTTPLSSLDRMDVDDLIPGLIGVPRDNSTFSPGASLSDFKSSHGTAFFAEQHSPIALPGSADKISPTNNGVERTSTTSVDTAASDSLTPTLQANLSYASLDGDNGFLQRRGLKRPVAADFVDFDNGPGSSRGYGSSSSNGHSNGGPHPNPLSRRKAGSFAGISGMRRCVIELSDSEDEDDNQALEDRVGNGDAREYSPAVTTAFTTRAPPRLTATPSMPSSLGALVGNNGNVAQPPPAASATNALAEKEEEIKRMRQLIAQREELRLKKLAAMSGKSTPVITPTAEVQTSEVTVVVKQEESVKGSLSCKNSSILLPSRDREDDSSPELTRYGSCCLPSHPHVSPSLITAIIGFDCILGAMADGKRDPVTSDNSATARSLGTSGTNNDRNGISTQETSSIGSLSRFSASPTVG